MLHINEMYDKSNDLIKTQMMQMILMHNHIPLEELLRELLKDIEHRMANIEGTKSPQELADIYKPLAYAKQHTQELLNLFTKIEKDNEFQTNDDNFFHPQAVD